MKPYNVEPIIEGYQPHKKRDISNKFPDCCDFHEMTYKALQNEFIKSFPLFKKQFESEYNMKPDIAYYENLPNKIIRQLSYTEYFISQKIDAESWYTDLVHYIDYNIFSFGYPNSGSLWYVNMVRYYLEKVDNEIDEVKKGKIITYLNLKAGIKNYATQNDEDSNLKLIYKTFKKWHSLIPFEIPEFKDIDKYDKWILVTGIRDVNPYNGMINLKLVTKSELIELLKNYTRSLIQMVDSTYLLREEDSNKINQHHRNLTNLEYKFNKEKFLGDFDTEENSYVELLDNWLKNEMNYIEKIKTQIRNGELIFKNEKIPPGLKTFDSGLSVRQLDVLREKLIANEIIELIAREDFLYLFNNKTIFPSMVKIKWLKSNSWCFDLLNRLIYFDKPFSKNQTNYCIVGKNGKSINSNSGHGEIPEITEIIRAFL